MININYGQTHFKDIVTDELYYVDRTHYLPILENSGAAYVAFLRPRRFGKSLWISVLEHYYGTQYKDDFEFLFGKYSIGKNPTKEANSYLILRFNFSGISTDTDEKLHTSFLKEIKRGVSVFMTDYSDYFNEKTRESILNNTESHDLMRSFFEKLRNAKHPIYLLLDEYDHYANELITLRLESFKKLVTQNGWVRKFYESLKNATNDGVIGRMFITGVSPITLDSMTSGFNIVSNLSSDFQLHNLMGFTKDEVEQIMRGIGIENGELTTTMNTIKEWYNGYCFNEESPDLLYNSILVSYFAREYAKYGKYPKKMLDGNIATDYGKISKVFQIGDLEEQRWEYMDKLMAGEAIEIYLTDSYSFDRGFSPYDFLSLLYYMGFLTIKEDGFDGSVFLKMPNRVIETLYRDYFLEIMDKRAGNVHDMAPLHAAFNYLSRENNPRPLLDILCENLKQLSHRDFQKLDEKHIQVLFFAYVSMMSSYDTKSEYESEKQFYDILMTRSGLANARIVNEFLFEFKYAKTAKDKRLGTIDEEAKTQVNRYLQHQQVKKHPNLHAWRVVIVGYTLEICGEIEIL